MSSKDKSWRFSARELRAVLFLLPLLAVLVWVFREAARPRQDESAQLLGDRIADGSPAQSERSGAAQWSSARDGDAAYANRTGTNAERGAGVASTDGASAAVHVQAKLFRFDPNTVTYEELRRMGFTQGTAAGIVKYRQRGKVFQIPEDFATCYGVSDSMYAALKPYIIIGEPFRLRSFASSRSEGGRNATRTERASAGSAAPTRWGDEIDTVQAGATETGRAEFGAHTVTSGTGVYAHGEDGTGADAPETSGPGASGTSGRGTSRSSRPRAVVELNGADSATLVALYGIGARSASEIIRYRDRLGGFHSPAQLAEIPIVTERNYEAIVEQIVVDSCKIQKIDINFASPDNLAGHPYIPAKLLRKILKNRQLKGGWSSTEQMLKDHTLTSTQAAQLAPYLRFNH